MCEVLLSLTCAVWPIKSPRAQKLEPHSPDRIGSPAPFAMNTPAPANPFRNILVLFFTLGVGCTSIAAYLIADTSSFVNKASHADGVVVAFRQGTRSTWSIVAYKSASGAGFNVQSNVTNRGMVHLPIGARADVLYDAHEPSNARINTFLDLWGLALVFGPMGLVCLALGSFALVQSARISQRHRAVLR
jgi:uncharacterized protein DUF3592